MAKRSPHIDAGTVLSGDKIRATFDNGYVVRTVTAVVGAVIYEGTRRVFKTREGEELYEWNLGSKLNPLVELLDPTPVEQEPLPGM